MSILEEIFRHKAEQVAEKQKRINLSNLHSAALQAPVPPDFVSALRSKGTGRPVLIAEIKRASPSRGLLAPSLDPVELAAIYQKNGAAAISVLTDERYFQGSLADLERVASARLGLPLLRKDFIFDPYQLFEARLAGASAILLIAAALDASQLFDLHAQAQEIGLTALIEVHHEKELDSVLAYSPRLVGINNRDLHDFSVNLATTRRLRPLIPAHIRVVAESGIHSRQDIDDLAAVRVDAILVGEALVTAQDIAEKVRSLAC